MTNSELGLAILKSDMDESIKEELITRLVTPKTMYKWNQINWWEKPTCRSYEVIV